MKKTITLLTLFFSLITIGQNEKINQLNKENQKTGIWKLTSKNKDIEITTEFLEGKYVSETKYYKDKKLVASYNNQLNELLIITDSISTKAKFLINEDASRTLVGIDGTEIDEVLSNYFNSFSDIQPLYEGGIEKFYAFVAKNLSLGSFHGRLKIQFNVDSNGFVNNIELIEGNDVQLEKDAKKVFHKSLRWQPAHKNGVFKDTIMIFPLTIN
jgi:Gram-negative bacterial TonB protein C-terminal